MTIIKKVPGRMPYVTRFRHLDQQRRNVQRALNSIPASSDEKVSVSAFDTTPGYLGTKLTQGTGITLTPSGGGNETLEISSGASDFSEVITISTVDAAASIDIFTTLTAYANKYIRLISTGVAGTKQILIPLDATIDFPIGTEFTLFWATPTVIPGDVYRIRATVGVTFNFFSPTFSPGAGTAVFGGSEHTAITIKKVGINLWDGVGNIV